MFKPGDVVRRTHGTSFSKTVVEGGIYTVFAIDAKDNDYMALAHETPDQIAKYNWRVSKFELVKSSPVPIAKSFREYVLKETT